MQNRIEDLNNHLFMTIEKLMDDDLSDEQLDKEIKRAKAVVHVSGEIIKTADLRFKAMQFAQENQLMVPDHIAKGDSNRKLYNSDLPKIPHSGRRDDW